MKIFETRNARLLIIIANIFLAGFFLGQGNGIFIVNIVWVTPLLIKLFSNKI